MTFLSTLYQKLMKRKIIKYITLTTIAVNWFTFFLSYIIVRFFGNPMYSPLYHLISHMASAEFTPAPFLFDIGCILTGILSFPISLYIFNNLKEKTNEEFKEESPKSFKFVMYLILISGILGDIGFIGIGLYSIDRNYWNIHFIFAGFLFVGYYLSAFLVGILVLFSKIKINKHIGFYGLISSTVLFLILAIFSFFNMEIVIFEWISALMLYVWLYLFLFAILKKENY
ncbi:MAG: membrane protein of unknown function [Promethearchaeota archaeon]|nr:MAG: membrane protein of unknown function [Candidatus Lokiarchaeota archaeon]